MRAPAHGGKGDQGNDAPILFVRVSAGRRSWYFIGRDGQTHGPFATERNAVKAERAQWERAQDAK